MQMSVLTDSLKSLQRPRVVLRYSGLRFEGIVLSIDEDFLELFDDKRDYKKFLKVDLIEDLEVKQ